MAEHMTETHRNLFDVRNPAAPMDVPCPVPPDHAQSRASRPNTEVAREDLRTLLYAVSHDLKGPTTTIGAFARLLLEEYPEALGARGELWLQHIRDGAQTLTRRLEGLMTYCRMNESAQPLQTLDLVPLSRSILDEFPIGARAHADLVCDQASVWIEADEQQIRALVHNLLSNAVKYRKPDQDARVRVEIREADGRARLDVRDDGIGFDANRLPEACRMFRRFVTDDQYEGTGVGLALCDRIVQRHGATLSATSSPGCGACLTVCFPTVGATPHE